MGKMIDHRYELVKKIGEGGMGAVYLADDTRLDRRVAVKRLHLVGREADLHMFQERFEREAKVMAQFQHPNIVSVYDYGRDDEGIYLVLEYLPDGSLTQYMRTNAVTVQDAVRILLPLADALQTIHDLGRVHRDVKPSNILFDPYGHPKLADFGVVKLLEGQDGNTLTATGAAVGTPAYMAPELISGDASPAADQYALGVVCYELVTGKKPFKGRTPMETMYMQKAVPLPDPLEINPELPAWIRSFLAQALAKDPRERFVDMRAFADALEQGAAVSLAFTEEQTQLVGTPPVEPTAQHKPQPTSAAQLPVEVPNATVVAPLPQREDSPDASVPGYAATPAPSTVASKKTGFPAWLLWAGGGAVLLGILIVAGILLLRGITAAPETPLAGLVEETVTVLAQAESEITATPQPAATFTSPPTETTAPTETATPTIEPTPTLGNGSVRVRESDSAPMVYVPAGPFPMGSTASTDEAPVHEVVLDAFWIDQYEVTNRQYELCVDAGACSPPETGGSETRAAYFGEEAYADYPVAFVDWFQADAYCQWTGGRLPTEAEWEKAARGTDERVYPWGNDAPTCDLTNYEIAPSTWCVGDTSEVGSYPAGASPFGALDMAGNLWEWVADWYAADYYSTSPEANPTGPLNGADKVIRGGAWGYYEDGVRSADRGWSAPSIAYRNGGFRCVVDVN